MEVAGLFETLASSYRKARCHVSEDLSLIFVLYFQKTLSA